MNLEQGQEGQIQYMLVPQMQMVPCCFVAPEFCEGMWVPSPFGGYDAASPQGGKRGQFPPQHDPFMMTPQNSFGGGQPQQDPSLEESIAVELSSLPKMLCTRGMLEAAIEQAGLESLVRNLEIHPNSNGKAVLTLAGDRAAQRCIRHFNNLKWGRTSDPVCARYQQQTGGQEAVVPQGNKDSGKTKAKATAKAPRVRSSTSSSLVSHASAPSTPSLKASQSPMTSATCTPMSGPSKSPMSSPASSPLSLPMSSPGCSPLSRPRKSPLSSPSSSPMTGPAKPRWADYDSDDADDDVGSKSTRTGTVDSSGSGDSSSNE